MILNQQRSKEGACVTKNAQKKTIVIAFAAVPIAFDKDYWFFGLCKYILAQF